MIQKLSHYGITGKTLKWIEAFLQHRSQFVVALKYCLSHIWVIPGLSPWAEPIPHHHPNDIVKCSSSTLRMFVDDCCVYHPINSSDDYRALDQDLTNLHNWSNDWQMSFNIAKCKLLSITNKHKPNICTYRQPRL